VTFNIKVDIIKTVIQKIKYDLTPSNNLTKYKLTDRRKTQLG